MTVKKINTIKLPTLKMLNEVLGVNVEYVHSNLSYFAEHASSELGVRVNGSDNYWNIYELAHMCKQKATEKGYTIQTSNLLNGTGWYDVWCMDKHALENFEDEEVDFSQGKFNTEPTAIFSAFGWILEKQKAKNVQ